MTRKKIIISIVILTFNSEKYIRNCISSIKKSNYKNIEIVIVDNNSNDNTDLIVKKIKNIRYYPQNTNSGFSKGVNFGIKQSRGKYILVLNPDSILRRDSISRLVTQHLDSQADISGGKSLKKNRKIHGSYVRKPNIFTLLFDYTNLRKIVPNDIFHKKHYYHDLGTPVSTIRVDAVSGSYMLFKRKFMEKIGYFDENFFMYLEDVDFCVRATERGYKVIYCPESVITHIGGASSNNKDRINHDAWNKSRSYYTKKRFGLVTNFFMQPIYFLDEIITNLWSKLR